MKRDNLYDVLGETMEKLKHLNRIVDLILISDFCTTKPQNYDEALSIYLDSMSVLNILQNELKEISERLENLA